MRLRLPALLILSALAICCRPDRIDVSGGDRPETFGPGYIFDDTVVPKLSIEVSRDEWGRLLSLFDKDNHTHEYIRCGSATLERDDKVLRSTDAGLRLRGQTSRRRPEDRGGRKHHVHFGLHLRKFSETGNFAGVRRINLKYAKEDPTYVREHFCYDMLMRYGVWTAPRSSWCRLYIKTGDDAPVNYGVYLMTESIDRQYVKNRPQFGGSDGFLWKCAWGANLRDRDAWRYHLDDNSSGTYAYELKEDDPDAFPLAVEQLEDFIFKLWSLSGAEFCDWIRKVCDTDLLLKMYAANVALGHWDDYWNNMNNFYLYFNSRDKENYRVFLLPYDYDNTLGTSHRCGVQTDSGRHDPYNWGLKECILLPKLLSFHEFRDRYTQYLRDFSATDNPYTGVASSAARIKDWESALRQYVPNDLGEDNFIADAPASWGNHPEYRLLQDSPNNWFRVKAESIAGWIKR